MFTPLENWLRTRGIPADMITMADYSIGILILAMFFALSMFLARRLLVPSLEALVRRSSNRWDDTLAQRGFFRRLGALLPLVILFAAADFVFTEQILLASIIKRLTLAVLVAFSIRGIISFLDAVLDIYHASDDAPRLPVRGFLEAMKIVITILAVIFVIAILIDQSPWGIMSLLGGLTAVLILVFKDTLLGFVASIQISANDMVREGDWIEMPQYGADGDVIDVSIHTVKVRNWDKTITTIPTYALVSNSFKNWRGMSESGGRRIKRALYVDMNSIRFCSPGMLEKFARFNLLKEYLSTRQVEIDLFNQENQLDTATVVNGRRQTNIGIFRAYIVAYLKANPKIHQGMTFLVRHLPPGPQGLPIEIYVFSNDQVWANYEAIQADIFDHLLAALPEFELRVFQYPTGTDLSKALTGTTI
ncbi:MAG: mechanosensitive ion channel family protein [Proteobacteria bacterium]|nr:mechanosensitive ion channel family protein [Pseudomonadota bacterium]MBU1685786.1 mechanosensitive ion channel family protein [Pseudomonadota bacterium]